jgi:hypothetical protein
MAIAWPIPELLPVISTFLPRIPCIVAAPQSSNYVALMVSVPIVLLQTGFTLVASQKQVQPSAER